MLCSSCTHQSQVMVGGAPPAASSPCCPSVSCWCWCSACTAGLAKAGILEPATMLYPVLLWPATNRAEHTHHLPLTPPSQIHRHHHQHPGQRGRVHHQGCHSPAHLGATARPEGSWRAICREMTLGLGCCECLSIAVWGCALALLLGVHLLNWLGVVFPTG
jgi:hypothetical protein